MKSVTACLQMDFFFNHTILDTAVHFVSTAVISNKISAFLSFILS